MVAFAPPELAQALQRSNAQLLEPMPPLAGPWAVDPGEEPTAADHARDQRLGPRSVELAGAERGLGRMDGSCGRVQVDPGAFGQVELIAAEGGGDERLPGAVRDRFEQAADLADQRPHGHLPTIRWAPVPDLLDQLVAGHRGAMLGGEHGEDDPALGSGERLLWDQRRSLLDAHRARQIDPDAPQPDPNPIPTLPGQASTQEVDMQMLVECECGWSLQGPEDALIEATRQHAREAQGMELTREQVLAAAKPSQAR
jgi:hypothetical protein